LDKLPPSQKQLKKLESASGTFNKAGGFFLSAARSAGQGCTERSVKSSEQIRKKRKKTGEKPVYELQKQKTIIYYIGKWYSTKPLPSA